MVTVSVDSVPRGEHVPTADHRVWMHGLSWFDFESFFALRGDAGPRVTYLEGTLELMSPSRDHEQIKNCLAEVVAAYLEHASLSYNRVGSWLLKYAPKDAGIEPDECFIVGDRTKQRPDLAIEVVWTSGGVAKLEVYRRLGVGEVWFWKDDALTFHVLGGEGYEERDTSVLLPSFDRALAYEMMQRPWLSDVRRVLRERIR